MALAAVTLAMEKPAGGAVELWLGCTSLGMPLWEASWWPKAALNWGSCCLGWVEARMSRGEGAGAPGGAVKPVRPLWGIAERAAMGCRVTERLVEGGVDREVDMR